MSTLPRFEAIPLPRSLVVVPPLTDDEFEAFCLANEDLQIERTNEGTIYMNPPTGRETSRANLEISARLFIWWSTHRRGEVVDSSGGFYLPDGSALSPDGAYLLPETLARMTDRKSGGFYTVCPDFVIELLSVSDSLAKTQAKMDRWIANGAQLGWLIDPYRKHVFIYRPGVEMRAFSGRNLEGHGPVEGFVLDLSEIWRYYGD
ncbi:MAG: Uma2 family endonuclease [Terracidiphilus sp.]